MSQTRSLSNTSSNSIVFPLTKYAVKQLFLQTSATPSICQISYLGIGSVKIWGGNWNFSLSSLYSYFNELGDWLIPEFSVSESMSKYVKNFIRGNKPLWLCFTYRFIWNFWQNIVERCLQVHHVTKLLDLVTIIYLVNIRL